MVLKGAELLYAAERLRSGEAWPWLAVAVGLFLGGLKAKFIFHKFCRMNLARIEALAHPRAWQFFRPQFFILLFLMILVGGVLSQLARNNYPALIGVAMLDFSIAAALLGSSFPYWRCGGRPGS